MSCFLHMDKYRYCTVLYPNSFTSMTWCTVQCVWVQNSTPCHWVHGAPIIPLPWPLSYSWRRRGIALGSWKWKVSSCCAFNSALRSKTRTGGRSVCRLKGAWHAQHVSEPQRGCQHGSISYFAHCHHQLCRRDGPRAGCMQPGLQTASAAASRSRWRRTQPASCRHPRAGPQARAGAPACPRVRPACSGRLASAFRFRAPSNACVRQ